MKSLGYAIAAAAFGLLRLAVRALVLGARVAALTTVPVVAAWAAKVKDYRRPVRANRQEPDAGCLQIPHENDATTAQAGRATIIQAKEFDVADRIVCLRLDPPVGVINLRVYTAQALVRRDLIVSEPHLRTLLKGRRHALPDVPFDRVRGLDEIKTETLHAVQSLIKGAGKRTRSASRPRKERVVRSNAPASTAPQPAAADSSRGEPMDPALQARESLKAGPCATSVVAPKVTTGFTYVGQLVKAGCQTVKPQGRLPYEVFEATLQLENGAELALRGAELERELSANSCSVGQRVAITPMGKVPVTLANGNEGQKNLYRVRRMDAPH